MRTVGNFVIILGYSYLVLISLQSSRMLFA